ncbi:hypothetical protein AAFN47_18865 [Hoeflea sp. CAU 1731]
MAGLVHNNDALPQYALTTQRIVSVLLERENGKPVRISDTSGEIWHFDENGQIRKGLVDSMRNVSRVMDTLASTETVVELKPHTERKKRDEKYRWEPGRKEINIIIADLWPKKKSDRLKFVKGTSVRRPPFTADAERCMRKVSADFWMFDQHIGMLSEPGLKGFAYEARERAEDKFPETPELYEALAAMADRHLAIHQQWRSGKGVWYALVELLQWDSNRSSEVVGQFYERCNGRKEAVKAVRRLMAEHVSKFSDNVTVEGQLMTEPEWKRHVSMFPEDDD